METKKYSGFFCLKCKRIPLFQIIYKNNEIKIFSACKCHKQYEKIDSFIKNKYHENIQDIENLSNESLLYSSYIEENKKEDKFDINLILNNFIESREKMNEIANKIKKEIKEIYNKKIEEINEIYDKYMNNNNKVIFLIEKLIASFKLVKDNQTIIENIKNNCNFNKKYDCANLLKDFNSSIKLSFQKIENYFEKELIISINNKSPIYKKIESRYSPSCNDVINSFIQLDDDICASCAENDSNIVLYDLKNEVKEKITFKAHSKKINYIIKSYKDNIISTGEDGLIKIWPTIGRYLLLDTKKKFDIENKNKFKMYYNYNYKKIELKLNPIFTINYDYKNSIRVEKMFNFSNKNFLTCTKELINVYSYEINNINDIHINKISELEHNLSDIFYLRINEKDAIAIILRNNIDLFYLEDLTFINKIDINPKSKNCLLQLNSQEILIVDNHFHINIYDINNYKLRYKIRSYNDTDYFMNLNDGTIIFSSFEGIERYLIKTMEELPQLVKFNNNDLYDEYYDSYYDYDYYNEKVVFLYKLKDKRIVACYKNGTIEIINIKF